MISVEMKPGRIELKRTFCAPNSSAAFFIISSMPALPTQYAPKKGWVTWPAIEDMPMNEPPPFATRCGIACFRLKKVPITFSSSTRLNSFESCMW